MGFAVFQRPLPHGAGRGARAVPEGEATTTRHPMKIGEFVLNNNTTVRAYLRYLQGMARSMAELDFERVLDEGTTIEEIGNNVMRRDLWLAWESLVEEMPIVLGREVGLRPFHMIGRKDQP